MAAGVLYPVNKYDFTYLVLERDFASVRHSEQPALRPIGSAEGTGGSRGISLLNWRRFLDSTSLRSVPLLRNLPSERHFERPQGAEKSHVVEIGDPSTPLRSAQGDGYFEFLTH